MSADRAPNSTLRPFEPAPRSPQAAIVHPIVNLNGSPVQRLIELNHEVDSACKQLISRMRYAWPHGRDFQYNDDDDLPTALNHAQDEVLMVMYIQQRFAARMSKLVERQIEDEARKVERESARLRVDIE